MSNGDENKQDTFGTEMPKPKKKTKSAKKTKGSKKKAAKKKAAKKKSAKKR
jgi:hypothetical protein